jgi:hypothetical protein
MQSHDNDSDKGGEEQSMREAPTDIVHPPMMEPCVNHSRFRITPARPPFHSLADLEVH